jgi:hypothetical protein
MRNAVRVGGAALFFLLPLSGAARMHGQETSAEQPAAKVTDAYGDALPDGAIARLGTLRLTHLGGISALAVSADGRIAASGVHHGKEVYLGEKRSTNRAGFRSVRGSASPWPQSAYGIPRRGS